MNAQRQPQNPFQQQLDQLRLTRQGRLPVSPGLGRFNGGLEFDDYHDEAARQPIQPCPIPPELVLPLQQHIGDQAVPVVEVGQTVYKGQLLGRSEGYVSAPVHAPTSGTVIAIGPQAVPHPSGLQAVCITLRTDGRDQSPVEPELIADKSLYQTDRVELRNRIREAGVVGLGGAAFPTAVKLNPGRREVTTLIVNAAECEPYICCDDRLLTERSDQLLYGIEVVCYCLDINQVIIGIEDTMPNAYKGLLQACAARYEAEPDYFARLDIQIKVVPTRYPTGGEKQLIKVLTNQEVPSHGLPADIGLVCHNPGTLVAAYRAVAFGEPLTTRIVTVTGSGVANPVNVEAMIGTPASHLVAVAGGYTDKAERLIFGGPMMGFAMYDDGLPIVKATNCVLVAAQTDIREPREAMPCIRCGACEQACPANLLPQQLYWYAKSRDFEKTEEYNLFDCIECGACSYVCPSEIPLVQYYRFAKTEIAKERRERDQSDHARERFEFRNERLEREKLEKAEKLRQKKAALAAKAKAKIAAGDTKQDEIQAALARVKAKKAQTATPEHQNDRLDTNHSDTPVSD